MGWGTESDDRGSADWEVRPCGMLVQRRSATVEGHVAAPEIRVRVSYGARRYEISVNSQATFGELKKLLIADTKLEPAEQKITYRGKERDNGKFLDACGVKDRSKVVLMEDPSSRERKYIEMKRIVRIRSAQQAIANISFQVDELAAQVTAIEKSIFNGNKVAEVQITTLIELLMRQAIKLDSIPTEGDVSSQKSIQVQAKRVQKSVETLDGLKISNAKVEPLIFVTKWETFDPPSTPKWEFFE